MALPFKICADPLYVSCTHPSHPLNHVIQIKTVNNSGICPSIHLYKAKTTRRREDEENIDEYYTPVRDYRGNVIEQPLATIRHSACPAIGGRKQGDKRRPKKRGGANSVGQRKSDESQYYDFTNNLLDIEVVHDVKADPFEDPPESTSSKASSISPNPHSPSPARHRPGSTTPSPSTRPDNPLGSAAESHKAPRTDEASSSSSHKGDANSRSKTPPRKDGRSSSSSPSSASSSGYTSFERSTIEGKVFRIRIVSHVQAEFARQHRLFLFQIVLINRFARLVRWDRAGAVVTELFDYVDKPDLLAEFLWRFDHMSDEERGLDTTVTLASMKEKKQLELAVGKFLDSVKALAKAGVKGTRGSSVRALPGVEDTLDDTHTYPTCKVRVVDSATRKSTELIIRRPFSAHSSLWGRATRAYVAYDVKAARLVCLKDTWRLDDPELRAESKIYRELKRHDVPNIPTVLYGGDVRNPNRRPQETFTQALAEEEDDWRITLGTFERYIHHRLIQDIVYPLKTLVDEHELIQVLHDVLCGE